LDGAATIFVVVTVLTIALFASTSVYTGPIAKLLDGTDIGYFVGFIVAAALYATIARLLSKAKK
jgi:purine-cytosine permease-like protein